MSNPAGPVTGPHLISRVAAATAVSPNRFTDVLYDAAIVLAMSTLIEARRNPNNSAVAGKRRATSQANP